MSTKHTNGPWEAITVEPDAPDDPSRYAIICAADPYGTKANDIAMVWLRGGNEKTAANARLIAAAPELLEAAKLVIAWYEAEDDHSKADFYQRMQMCRDSESALRTAIAKATGGQP